MEVLLRSFNGAADWAWFNKHNDIKQTTYTTGIVAVNKDKEEVIAAVVMDSWTANSVQCHIIITNPMVLRHKFLECAANFIFVEHGRRLIYSLIASNNEKSLKLAKHMGFTVKTRLEEAYAVGVDYVLVELRRKDCMYIDKAARDG